MTGRTPRGVARSRATRSYSLCSPGFARAKPALRLGTSLRIWTGRNRFGACHPRSEEHTSELQSLMRISYAVFCLKKKKTTNEDLTTTKLQDTTTPIHPYKITKKI